MSTFFAGILHSESVCSMLLQKILASISWQWVGITKNCCENFSQNLSMTIVSKG